jgi:hypothetical protein
MRKLNQSNTVFAELSPVDIVKSNKKDESRLSNVSPITE